MDGILFSLRAYKDRLKENDSDGWEQPYGTIRLTCERQVFASHKTTNLSLPRLLNTKSSYLAHTPRMGSVGSGSVFVYPLVGLCEQARFRHSPFCCRVEAATSSQTEPST